MPNPQVKTRSGGTSRVPPRVLDAFTAAFRGQLLTQTQPVTTPRASSGTR